MTELGSSVAGKTTVDGGDSMSAPARLASSVMNFGDRMRFTVELRTGETTIVSWKKLMKDASKAEGGGGVKDVAATAVVDVPEVMKAAVPNTLEGRLELAQPVADDDAPAPNRFSAVIEKIERLYKGKDSSDEEELDDVPDDDQYDTEDSFIDDAELDEYFQVDKSKTKHDGYFVNRGTLEKVIEPTEPADQQPKKRRRKEMAKAADNNDDGQRPSKHIKAVKKPTEKSVSSEKGLLPTSEGPSVKKTDIFPAKHIGNKVKEASGNGNSIESMHKSHPLMNNFEESEIGVQKKDKSAMLANIDLNLPDIKHSMQPVKNSVVQKKESSSLKLKANVLEKAIRELEKLVSESRPPALDAQDGDPSLQCIKRRLPQEIKQKLDKVARLAHASNGNVSNELLNRLMGIVGHLCQVRTLKRHLNTMVSTSLSAKQEKDEKFQMIKKEVVEMVNAFVPSLMSKAIEQQSGRSDDLQESSHSEKATKGQLCMSTTLEDKICDLYDIFVDGLDEDAAPQVRKLYAELAELWPKGVMDNHGIKRAICRAKERRRALSVKNKEKIRRKKLATTNAEQTAHMESNIAAQSQNVNMKAAVDPNTNSITHLNGFPATNFGAGTFAPLMNVSNSDGPIPERAITGKHSSSLPEARIVDGIPVGVKKKAKKRARNLVEDIHMRAPEKFSSNQADDAQKHQHKHPGVSLQGGSHKSSHDPL